MKPNTIFWDVDTQADFMLPEGGLYIKDAEYLINRISLIREFALEHGFSIVASTDWHYKADKEISANPDYHQSFPAHCLADTAGAERVGYLGGVNIVSLDMIKMNHEKLAEYLDKKPFHLVLRKREIDVFSNPNSRELVKLIHPESVYIFGAVFEYCVYLTINQLLSLVKPQITVILDALVIQDEKAAEKIFKELLAKGILFKTFAEIRKELI